MWRRICERHSCRVEAAHKAGQIKVTTHVIKERPLQCDPRGHLERSDPESEQHTENVIQPVPLASITCKAEWILSHPGQPLCTSVYTCVSGFKSLVQESGFLSRGETNSLKILAECLRCLAFQLDVISSKSECNIAAFTCLNYPSQVSLICTYMIIYVGYDMSIDYVI